MKNPHWYWKLSGYIALAGTAGAAQTLAWIGGLRDPHGFRTTRRKARLMGMAATAAGTALLIADLKTTKSSFAFPQFGSVADLLMSLAHCAT